MCIAGGLLADGLCATGGLFADGLHTARGLFADGLCATGGLFAYRSHPTGYVLDDAPQSLAQPLEKDQKLPHSHQDDDDPCAQQAEDQRTWRSA